MVSEDKMAQMMLVRLSGARLCRIFWAVVRNLNFI
jgi:hypothetical protein